MFNKIYGKVKQFIKENYKFLIGYIIAFIICLYPLPYYIYTGGGTINLENRFKIEDEYKEKGSFNLLYVREIRATIPTYLLSYVFNWERDNIKNYQIDDESRSEIWQREKLYLQESIDNAIINAYKLAGEEINIKETHYKVLNITSNADTDLKINDTILKINDVSIINYEDISNSIMDVDLSEKVKLLVKRDKKEITCYGTLFKENDLKKLGVYLIKKSEYDTARSIDVDFSSREGGSSGGFMLSLAIYNRLIKEDLTKGLTIAGTGTIDEFGNVGSIGGVKHKLKGAVQEKADLIFMPDGKNYEEAMKEKKEYGYKIEIVSVKTLEEAVSYLEGRK